MPSPVWTGPQHQGTVRPSRRVAGPILTDDRGGTPGSSSSISSGVDKVHLSLDLDVLPASVAPGVSAPNGFGLSTACVRTALRLVAQSGKLGLFEVAELNPTHDVGGRTARTAARLIDETLRSTV